VCVCVCVCVCVYAQELDEGRRTGAGRSRVGETLPFNSSAEELKIADPRLEGEVRELPFTSSAEELKTADPRLEGEVREDCELVLTLRSRPSGLLVPLDLSVRNRSLCIYKYIYVYHVSLCGCALCACTNIFMYIMLVCALSATHTSHLLQRLSACMRMRLCVYMCVYMCVYVCVTISSPSVCRCHRG
jgi:hypothetical protein